MAASWYLAPSLVALRNEVNRRWPNRLRTSDGSVGDTSHAARASDHNPDWDDGGVVRALDIDEDLDGNPADGSWDARAIVDPIVARRDPRVAYLIYEGQIISSTVSPWVWRPYTGVNAHGHHVHVSILHTDAAENDTSRWLAPAPTLEDDVTPEDHAKIAAASRAAADEAAKQAVAFLNGHTSTLFNPKSSDTRDAWMRSAVSLPAILAAVKATDVDVDEAELARLLLASLTPQAIASAIPGEFAAEVADELAARLAG